MPNLTPTRKTKRQATSAVAYTADPPAPDDPLLEFAPVPHTHPRRNSITADLQREFIAHLAATGIVTAAARHIGKSMEALYKLRARAGSEGFRAAWDAAIDRGVSRLEAGALTRAIEGEERMVVSSGKVLGTEVRHNEALVMFFLRGRLPHRYGKGDLVPGHPDYEALKSRLRAEWQAEAAADRASPENREANLKFFHELKQRWRGEWEREQAGLTRQCQTVTK
ncbi:hypothetical protein [Erythrobacter sp. F6033]|uniref:hypothetical protein n=1 Tax=Erythrobacter sp. F6033 TaxID=2926401 RepID=UPI001FF578F2|nr:hypothetical protein [Erythrobacter sp. F6033]MCK0127993.1 hypothetical protein [Erythrobacter sp. F6033]